MIWIQVRARAMAYLLGKLGMKSGRVIRVSLGLFSNFADVFRFLQFARTFLDVNPERGALPARPNF
jgi:selenocysteine lyase/cysteine desulfurase